jgi:hypothetical protein
LTRGAGLTSQRLARPAGQYPLHAKPDSSTLDAISPAKGGRDAKWTSPEDERVQSSTTALWRTVDGTLSHSAVSELLARADEVLDGCKHAQGQQQHTQAGETEVSSAGWLTLAKAQAGDSNKEDQDVCCVQLKFAAGAARNAFSYQEFADMALHDVAFCLQANMGRFSVASKQQVAHSSLVFTIFLAKSMCSHDCDMSRLKLTIEVLRDQSSCVNYE